MIKLVKREWDKTGIQFNILSTNTFAKYIQIKGYMIYSYCKPGNLVDFKNILFEKNYKIDSQVYTQRLVLIIECSTPLSKTSTN